MFLNILLSLYILYIVNSVKIFTKERNLFQLYRIPTYDIYIYHLNFQNMQLYRYQYYNIIITVYYSSGIEETFCEKFRKSFLKGNFVRIIQYIGRYLQQIYLFLYK